MLNPPRAPACRIVLRRRVNDSRRASPRSPGSLSHNKSSRKSLFAAQPDCNARHAALPQELHRVAIRMLDRPTCFPLVYPHFCQTKEKRFYNFRCLANGCRNIPPASGSASGAGETLAQCKTHHVVFPNQGSLRELHEPGPAHAIHPPQVRLSRLGRVSCLVPGAVRLRKSCRLRPYDSTTSRSS